MSAPVQDPSKIDPPIVQRPKTPVILRKSLLDTMTNTSTPPSVLETGEIDSSAISPVKPIPEAPTPDPPLNHCPKTPINPKNPIPERIDLDSPVSPRPMTPPKARNPTPEAINLDPPISHRPKTPVSKNNSSDTVESDTGIPRRPKTPHSLIKDQPEVELIPRKHSDDQRGSNNMKNKPGDAVTITAVSKRLERAKTPVSRPKTPVTRPKTPVVRPKTPVIRPRTPVTRSKTPVTRPKTPSERPKTPVDRPKTPGTRTNPERKRRKSMLIERELDAEDAEVERIIEEGEEEIRHKQQRPTRDNYCWQCHKDKVDAACSTCVRSWHKKCIGTSAPSSSTDYWVCGECASILKAENPSTRSPLMSNLTVDQLCMVLKHMITKLKQTPGCEVFMKPVDLEEVPNYLDFIVKPMDLTLLENNIKSKEYGSPDAFMADTKWILHNCIVFNTEGGKYTDTSRLTTVAKGLIKLAREEASELESCPTCYIRGRHLPRPQYTWFIDACKPPHLLVWAKLKGFPFWPAKVMPRWNKQGFVDVRFFGEHNRAWVSPKDLYLYSKEPPTATPRSKKHEIADCLREMSIHIKRLGETFGKFEYAPPKTPFNPYDPLQIKSLLPDYDPPIPVDNLLPRRGSLIGRGKKRKNDFADSADEANFYSDYDTMGDLNEDDNNEDAVVKGKETPIKILDNSKSAETTAKGLSAASIPGKRSRQMKSVKSLPKRGSRINLQGRTQGSRGSEKVPFKDTAALPATKTLAGPAVSRTRRHIPERINSEGKSINKRPKNSLDETGRSQNDDDDDDDNDDQPRAEGSRHSASIDEPEEKKNGEVKRNSKAKKSFPNKTSQMVACVSLQRQSDASQGLKSPVKLEASYQMPPADAGPLSSLLHRGADTLAKQMGLIIEESIKQAAQGKGTLAESSQADQAVVYELKMKLERIKWQHQQEIAELKHNSEKTWREIKATMKAENLRSIEEIKKLAEEEKIRCVAEAKSKQWCTCCGGEACMWCCWNTSYCSENCQELHWRVHSTKCSRRSSSNKSGEGSSKVNGQKEQSEAIPKSMNAQSNSSNVRGA